MTLKQWRLLEGLSAQGLAARLGMTRSPRSVLRIENGETVCDADLVNLIASVTDGKVTASDMHATRLKWLRAHRPDRFAPEPAE